MAQTPVIDKFIGPNNVTYELCDLQARSDITKLSNRIDNRLATGDFTIKQNTSVDDSAVVFEHPRDASGKEIKNTVKLSIGNGKTQQVVVNEVARSTSSANADKATVAFGLSNASKDITYTVWVQ